MSVLLPKYIAAKWNNPKAELKAKVHVVLFSIFLGVILALFFALAGFLYVMWLIPLRLLSLALCSKVVL